MDFLLIVITSQIAHTILLKKYKDEVLKNANKKDYILNASFLKSFIEAYYIETGISKYLKYIPVINTLSIMQVLINYTQNKEFYDDEFEKIGIYVKKEESRKNLIFHLNALLDDVKELPTKEDLIFINSFLKLIKDKYSLNKEDITISTLEERIKALDGEIDINKKKLR